MFVYSSVGCIEIVVQNWYGLLGGGGSEGGGGVGIVKPIYNPHFFINFF